MGIEILLGVVVFPIANKLGEKWIDRIATGIDENIIRLFKAAINDPAKQQDVTNRLRNDPELAGQLQRNITLTMESDDTVASLAATIVPRPGTKLEYYAALIRWIIRSGAKLGRHFVLKGFLHGELYLSYFIFNPKKLDDSDDLVYIVNDTFVTRTPITGPQIFVEKMDSAEARDEKFEALKKKARRSPYGKLEVQDYRRNTHEVEEIYEDYVWYGVNYGLSRRMNDLSRRMTSTNLPHEQEELDITTYAPIHLMVESLGELLADRIKDVGSLREAIESAELKVTT